MKGEMSETYNTPTDLMETAMAPRTVEEGCMYVSISSQQWCWWWWWWYNNHCLESVNQIDNHIVNCYCRCLSVCLSCLLAAHGNQSSIAHRTTPLDQSAEIVVILLLLLRQEYMYGAQSILSSLMTFGPVLLAACQFAASHGRHLSWHDLLFLHHHHHYHHHVVENLQMFRMFMVCPSWWIELVSLYCTQANKIEQENSRWSPCAARCDNTYISKRICQPQLRNSVVDKGFRWKCTREAMQVNQEGKR